MENLYEHKKFNFEIPSWGTYANALYKKCLEEGFNEVEATEVCYKVIRLQKSEKTSKREVLKIRKMIKQ